MASMERFTQRARHVLALAHQEAERTHQGFIGTEHLLLGLLEEDGGVAGRVLRELGLEIERVREMIQRISSTEDNENGKIELAPDTQQVLEFAIDEAHKMGHHYIGTEHLLLGLVRSEGAAMEVLKKLGVTPDQIRRQTRRVLQESTGNGAPVPETAKPGGKQEAKNPLVDQLATDLTTLAEEGKLDPVIGRQTEIERVIQILARRTKNNPALIGEPGVGKTAIVEGLAQRITDGDVPAPLLNKRVLKLDVGSLVAGTMYRGQFEERLKRVIDELKSTKSILFIDEFHMWWEPVRPGLRWTRLTFSNLPSHVVNYSVLVPPRWMSTANISNPMRLWNVASSQLLWTSQALKRLLKSSRVSAKCMRSTTTLSSRTRLSKPRPSSRPATFRTVSCPTRRLT